MYILTMDWIIAALALVAIFTDFDNDGDQDLFINHDFGYKRTPDMLLENHYPEKWILRMLLRKREWTCKINSMGTAVGDYNNDGLMDYYMTNIKFNYFMVNQGPGKPFVNKAKELGMNFFPLAGVPILQILIMMVMWICLFLTVT